MPGLLAEAGNRVPGWLTGARDRMVASDPGLTRLRMAGSAAATMGSALGIEYIAAAARHEGARGTLVAMLLGAVVGMMGSMALTGAAARAGQEAGEQEGGKAGERDREHAGHAGRLAAVARPSGWQAARHFSIAAIEFTEVARREPAPLEAGTAPGEESVDEFEPVVGLAMGYLPGSAAVARGVPARGSRWNPVARRAPPPP